MPKNWIRSIAKIFRSVISLPINLMLSPLIYFGLWELQLSQRLRAQFTTWIPTGPCQYVLIQRSCVEPHHVSYSGSHRYDLTYNTGYKFHPKTWSTRKKFILNILYALLHFVISLWSYLSNTFRHVPFKASPLNVLFRNPNTCRFCYDKTEFM